jgi:RimJ/RimL family protein N-acetyltransferase
MTPRPTLHTERLFLRPFSLEDAPAVQRLAGAREIAATTLNIPHPYEDGMAAAWIETHQERFEKGELVNFAVVSKSDAVLVGAIGLHVSASNARAELGYWIGVPFWGQGYATEAGRAVVGYAFAALDLNRVLAYHLGSNPASGRVMQKIGMIREGCLRQHTEKWGVLEDLVVYGILRDEWGNLT